jgi:hypothetical protein
LQYNKDRSQEQSVSVAATSYTEIIQSNVPRYMDTIASDEKRKIVNDILAEIQEQRSGRFLKRGLHGWMEVTPTEARQKITHALQYQQRMRLREEQEGRAFFS